MLKTILLFLFAVAPAAALADGYVFDIRLGDGSKATKEWAETLAHPKAHPKDLRALQDTLNQYGNIAIFHETPDFSVVNLTLLSPCKSCKKPGSLSISATTYFALLPEYNDGSCKEIAKMPLKNRLTKCYRNTKAFTTRTWLDPESVSSMADALTAINSYLYLDLGRSKAVMEKAIATYQIPFRGQEVFYGVDQWDLLENALVANSYHVDFGNVNYWSLTKQQDPNAFKVYVAGAAIEANRMVYISSGTRCATVDEKHPELEINEARLMSAAHLKVYVDAGKCQGPIQVRHENVLDTIPVLMQRYGFKYEKGTWLQR